MTPVGPPMWVIPTKLTKFLNSWILANSEIHLKYVKKIKTAYVDDNIIGDNLGQSYNFDYNCVNLEIQF